MVLRGHVRTIRIEAACDMKGSHGWKICRRCKPREDWHTVSAVIADGTGDGGTPTSVAASRDARGSRICISSISIHLNRQMARSRELLMLVIKL
jgi:hypothetical protein